MADNTQINAGGGDTIRDIDRGTAKTQVVVLDTGGAGGENLVDADCPLVVQSPYDCVALAAAMQALRLQAAQPQAGFVPIEIPFWGAF